MKPVSQWLHRDCVLATCLVFAACGSSPQQEAPPDPDGTQGGNYFVGSKNVYAHLESGSGGSWIFTEITESDEQPNGAYLVRLNDLAAAFDTRIAECTPQNYPTDHKCNPLHPFRNKEVGVIGKIISGGIAAGTAGKVTDVSRSYKTAFDEAEFNQAVDEALTNTDLHSNRRQLLTALEDYERTLADSRARLNELKTESDANYRNTGTVPLDIQPTITGLSEYYSRNINFKEIIELVPRTPESAGNNIIERKSLLPCNARRCMQEVRNAIASLQADVENVEAGLMDGRSGGRDVYDIRCDQTSHAGYLFRLSCPAEVARAETGRTPLPVSVHILARDFEGLYPSIQTADSSLEIAIDGDEVTFTNLTQVYLTVSAQTVYYNSQVQTSSSVISVAPGAAVRRPISEFSSPAIDIESSYRQMTPDKARGTSFRFGFAANYRVAGTADDTTLYDVRTFNVGCAIRNRVKPGSCLESPTRAAPTPGIN